MTNCAFIDLPTPSLQTIAESCILADHFYHQSWRPTESSSADRAFGECCVGDDLPFGGIFRTGQVKSSSFVFYIERQATCFNDLAHRGGGQPLVGGPPGVPS